MPETPSLDLNPLTDPTGWAKMAEKGAAKLEALQAADTGTPRDCFLIENTRLYIEVCRRFATDPGLASLAAQEVMADQFTVETGAMAKRYGVAL